LSIPWCQTPSGPGSAQPRAPPGGGSRRGTDAPVIADPARPAGQLAARPGRPGRCARRSDRRGSSILRFRAPAVRAARADRRAAALAAAAALTCPVRTAAELRRLAVEPEQLAGEQFLNAERPVHEPPVSGGLPASRPRCATGAYRDIRRSACLRDPAQVLAVGRQIGSFCCFATSRRSNRDRCCQGMCWVVRDYCSGGSTGRRCRCRWRRPGCCPVRTRPSARWRRRGGWR